MGEDFSKLKRPRYPMPDFVKQALDESGLMEAYHKRPAYQQNDYVGWINRAKRPETKEKRLRQMLEGTQTRRRLHENETPGIGIAEYGLHIMLVLKEFLGFDGCQLIRQPDNCTAD